MLKKFICFVFLLFLIFISFGKTAVNADSTSESMGFNVDELIYGAKKHYNYNESYVYNNKNIVGYSRLESAVYEDRRDSNFAVVIMYSTTQPRDYSYKCGLFKLFTCSVDAYVDYVKIYSDVDNTIYPVYHGVGYNSSGFKMKQPSPQPIAKSTNYTLGFEYSTQPKVSAVVQIEDGELKVNTNHDSLKQYFEVNYIYSCTFLGLDCSYRNKETYNKAMFLVDKSAQYKGNIGSFVNRAYIFTQYYVNNTNIYTSKGSTLLYY